MTANCRSCAATATSRRSSRSPVSTASSPSTRLTQRRSSRSALPALRLRADDRRFRLSGLVRTIAAASGLAAAALLAAGCVTGGISKGKADTAHGKQLFQEKCRSCHTLADAGTQGKIGPNLDDAFYGPTSE